MRQLLLQLGNIISLVSHYEISSIYLTAAAVHCFVSDLVRNSLRQIFDDVVRMHTQKKR